MSKELPCQVCGGFSAEIQDVFDGDSDKELIEKYKCEECDSTWSVRWKFVEVFDKVDNLRA